MRTPIFGSPENGMCCLWCGVFLLMVSLDSQAMLGSHVKNSCLPVVDSFPSAHKLLVLLLALIILITADLMIHLLVGIWEWRVILQMAD